MLNEYSKERWNIKQVLNMLYGRYFHTVGAANVYYADYVY